MATATAAATIVVGLVRPFPGRVGRTARAHGRSRCCAWILSGSMDLVVIGLGDADLAAGRGDHRGIAGLRQLHALMSQQ